MKENIGSAEGVHTTVFDDFVCRNDNEGRNDSEGESLSLAKTELSFQAWDNHKRINPPFGLISFSLVDFSHSLIPLPLPDTSPSPCIPYLCLMEQPNNPLHGVKLAEILEYLVENLGWEEMGRAVDIRCFKNNPSVKSSLHFLRRTAWARNKVEALYLKCKRMRS